MVDHLESGGTFSTEPISKPGPEKAPQSREEQAHAGQSRFPPLQVPPEFDRVRLGANEEGEVSAVATGSHERQRCLQASLRAFAKSMRRGISICVVASSSRTVPGEASMNSELTHLVVHMRSMQQSVALDSIEAVRVACDVEASGIRAFSLPTASPDRSGCILVEERCLTLDLRSRPPTVFAFESSRAREYFETCLKVLILAADNVQDAASSRDLRSESGTVCTAPSDTTGEAEG